MLTTVPLTSESIKQTEVRFEPWTTDNFGDGPLGRLLIIGESHYGKSEDDTPLLTHQVVADYIAGSNFRFFTTLSIALTEQDRRQIDRGTLWSKIGFYNYVQQLLPKARVAPSAAMFVEAGSAFFHVIDMLEPTHLIVCGMRLWSQMPDFTADGAYITQEDKRYLYGPYTRSWGTALALGINHQLLCNDTGSR